jgi:hypothetical protein
MVGGSPIEMSTTGKRSLGLRVLKFMLGTDQRAVAIAATGVCIALGNIYFFNIVDIALGPKPPLWQTVAAGLALSAFILPFFFMGVSRMLPSVTPWKAVSVLTGAMLYPVVLQRMSVLGISDLFVLVGGCIGFILVALPIATWIIQKLKKTA